MKVKEGSIDEEVGSNLSIKQRRPHFKDYVILMIIILLYSAVFSYLSYLRVLNFLALNWDLGIAMQTLWTTTHGYLMFETSDLTFFGVHSFLQIHSAYIAFPISYIYRLLPYSLTLFVIQATVLSSSIIPLYFLARNKIENNTILFLFILLYLFNFLMISGYMYDFHWESFLPLEFLSMFYLVERKKYALSLVPFIIGVSTLEVFPFLAMGIILFSSFSKFGLRFLDIKSMIFVREWRILTLIFVISVISYISIRAIQYILLPHLVGGTTQTGSVTASVRGLFLINLSFPFIGNASVYWLMLYASFGFLGLLSPKHFVLALPWFFFTIFLNEGYASLGFQYSLVAAPPIAVASVNGLSKIKSDRVPIFMFSLIALLLFVLTVHNSWQIVETIPLDVVGFLSLSFIFFFVILFDPSGTSKGERYAIIRDQLARKIPKARPISKGKVLAFLGILLVLNIALSPLNTNNFGHSNSPGYWLKYGYNAEYQFMGKLVEDVPQKATVLASDNLFPFVANNPNSYSLAWFPPSEYSQRVPFFPFNQSNLPAYVLVDASQFSLIPNFLKETLFNTSDYGLVSYVYSLTQYPGSIYLFEKGYKLNSPSAYYPYQNVSLFNLDGRQLSSGQFGVKIPNPNNASSVLIENKHVFNEGIDTGNIWYGPYYTFLPGKYSLKFNVSFNSIKGNLSENSTILTVDWIVFDTISLLNSNISMSKIAGPGYYTFSYTVNLSQPYPNSEIRGFTSYSNGTPNADIVLNNIQLERV
ncbi:hypothetical protein IX51_09410 [uncultured archaeon]|nr:hypothetical protein IX51_09410 [uncultured archaeon]